MKKCAKRKSFIATVLLLISAPVFILSGAFANKSADAYTATNHSTIGNVYLGGGKFDKGNLDKLAAKVGYNSGVGDLVTAATDFNYTTDNIGFKNSADFGDTVVKFGTYTYKNTEYELSWLPTFISKADNNDVILTLWLAGTESANGTVSDQEISTFTGSGWNNNAATKPVSNNYDTSKIRTAMLNNAGSYYSGYNNTSNNQETSTLTKTDYTPTSNGTNKYETFTTGALKDYIVAPQNVSWQSNASYMKNDAKWDAGGKTTDASGGQESYDIMGVAADYTSSWLNDKLWLPSIYETYDSTISADGTRRWDFTENGGLWKTDVNKRSNLVNSWLCSSTPVDCHGAYYLDSTGVCSNTAVGDTGAVRPALHLNLTKAAANSFNTIENIYDQANSKFSGANLNALAQAARFADVNAMIEYAKDGTQPNKTSQDFGDTLVNFGTYSYGGVQRELTWIPAYVSQDDKGNAILTLWLAGTDSGNGTVSNQELSTYSDGTYSPSATQSYNGATVYSNTYDSSYIRNYILNGSGNYAGDFGTDTAITKPAADTLTKFTQFTTGALKDYIVTPENVSWQNNASYMKNDAQWNASGKTTDASGGQESYDILGTAENYSAGWLTDKIWLPSMYETYDSSITSAGTRRWDFAENGGLWQTGNGEANRQKRSNPNWVWLRSGRPHLLNYSYNLSGTGGCSYYGVNGSGAVRPALHLNLNMAATSACDGNSHISRGEWLSDGTNHWKECTVCGAKIDSAAHTVATDAAVEPDCTNTGLTEGSHCSVCDRVLKAQEVVSATGHAWDTTVWLNDETNHWHKCANCTEITDNAEHTPSEWITDTPATCTKEGTQHKECTVCKKVLLTGSIPLAEHSWNAGTQTTAPTCTKEGVKTFTCTVCGETKTEAIPVIAHTPSDWVTDKQATCTEAGARHKICTVCNQTLESETVPKLDHTLGTWQHDDTNHWKLCSVCNTKQENAAHNFGAWTITKLATKDEQGEKRCECTVCGLTKTEVIAKLVEDEGGNGSVGDLPELPDPDSNYKLEITIKATDKVYALDGQSKGYNVRLWIVNNKNDEDKQELYKEEVTLSLIVPHGMEKFTLYQLEDGEFKEIPASEYTVESGVLTIHTKLPGEFIFNTAAAPAKGGIPWWIWLIVSLAVVAVIVVVVIIVVKKKHAPAPETETVYVNGESYDDTELKRKVEEQNEKIDELLNREIPVNALDQTLSDDEMRSFFTDQELQSMVKQGKITQEDCDRLIGGRK